MARRDSSRALCLQAGVFRVAMPALRQASAPLILLRGITYPYRDEVPQVWSHGREGAGGVSDAVKLSAEDQAQIQDFNQYCISASEEQNKAVTGHSDRLDGLLESCRMLQANIRAMSTNYPDPTSSLVNSIAEYGMMVAERPQGKTGLTFIQEVEAACRKLGFEAVRRDV
jgi:hypothetical protein